MVTDAWKFIKHLIEIRKTLSAGSSLDHPYYHTLTHDQQQLFQAATKRILRFSIVGLVTALVIVPVVAPLWIMWQDGISAYDAACRGALLLCLAPITLQIGLYSGVAIGFLTAPEWLLHSPLGERWRSVVGASTTSMARVVCCAMGVVGMAAVIALFWIARVMAPFQP